MISVSDLQNSTTGAAFSPMVAHAAPNRKANTTICNTSPRAMASITLAGKVCSKTPERVGLACGKVSTGVNASFICSPGRVRFTAAKPRNSAMVVSTSK
jgi:hypothetical protein